MRFWLALVIIGVLVVSGCITQPQSKLEGIRRIKHVVIIMQENRAFDHYFGTYPGAEGILMKNGTPAVCVPDPSTGNCVRPYHDTNDKNEGGPHGAIDAAADVDNGRMDGFIAQQEEGRKSACRSSVNPECNKALGKPDVMGYHDRREIPNYWKYVDEFVLQDRMFESSASWSLPAHLFLVSGWSARCKNKDPMSCTNELANPQSLANNGKPLDNFYEAVESGNLPSVVWIMPNGRIASIRLRL